MKLFWGKMTYSATGEGFTNIIYIAFADNEKVFKKTFIDKMAIDDYFQIGIEIGDAIDERADPVIFEHWRQIKNSCFGELKYEYYVNYS